MIVIVIVRNITPSPTILDMVSFWDNNSVPKVINAPPTTTSRNTDKEIKVMIFVLIF